MASPVEVIKPWTPWMASLAVVINRTGRTVSGVSYAWGGIDRPNLRFMGGGGNKQNWKDGFRGSLPLPQPIRLQKTLQS